MKRFATYLILSMLPCVAVAQIYPEPEKNVDCSVFIAKERRGNAQQGLEIWDRYVFALEDGGNVNVYDFKTASPEPLASFPLASSRPDNHANNASFGTETAKGASFPLLYVSNGKVGSDIEWTCFVESITRKGRRFSSEMIQTITLDNSGWKENGYVDIFGAPSWMVDRERNSLWVFSARKRTVQKVTRNAYENQYVATRFRVPLLSEGKEIILGVNDIEDQVVFPFDTWFTQAGCVHDGKIYYCFGLGIQDPSRPSRIRVYDTDTRTISARYELQEQIPNELEDIAVVGDWMYVNTNTNPAKTDRKPYIYKVSLPKSKPAPANALEELKRNPEKAGGVYYVANTGDVIVPDAPDGYKPFYINGYFRHGARHVDDNVTYPRIYEVLETAAAEGNLTGFGKAVYDRLEPFKVNVMYREGDLTGIGYRQSRELGVRMVDNYPEVFDGKPFVKANATNVLRVAATMHSVIEGILSRRPDLRADEIDNSRSFLKDLNQYGTVCPGRLQIDADIISGKGFWDKKYEEFLGSRIDADAFLSRLFIDIDKVKAAYEPYDLERRFYLMASLMQCLDRQVPLWDIFTEDEILALAEIENYRYYAQKGNEPVTRGRGAGLGARTLKHILDESRNDIDLGRHGIDLNFGHDGTLMALMVNLQAGDWALETSEPAEVMDKWRSWDIPMGTNLQFVFYRNAESDVLVRVMLNETDVKLPLETVSVCFYDWNELYDYYEKKCVEVEKSLAATAVTQNNN